MASAVEGMVCDEPFQQRKYVRGIETADSVTLRCILL